MNEPLAKINNLTIEYLQHGRRLAAVRDVSLNIEKGKTIGIVGESGCGKSTLALAMMGLLPPAESRIVTGTIHFAQENLIMASKEKWRQLRGRKISMIFQDPFSALNPVLKVGYQLQEALDPEDSKSSIHEKIRQLLFQVQLSETDRVAESYPHQLSGGQRQRVIIAMALARHPDLLIADEPTTALDVTVQLEILTLLKKLQKDLSMAMLFVTHNLDLIKDFSDQLAVMYAGQIVEYGETGRILSQPQHPYTQGLLKCRPTLKKTTGPIPVLEGQPPDPTHLPDGCPFHPRCSQIFKPCATIDPKNRKSGHSIIRCHLYPENEYAS